MEVLPNDLVRECLLRVAYTSHDNLKAVCRSWEAMVSNPKFYADRKISGKSEQLLCLIQRDPLNREVFVIMVHDPVKGTRERLPPIDDPRFDGLPRWCQCVAVNRKLVLIGGFDELSAIMMKIVYIYDFESARWSRGADMPTHRSFFACSVSSSTGLVYVAGIDQRRNPLEAAEAYNVEEDKWEILPPMIQPHGWGCRGVFNEGKFMVLGRGKSDRSIEAFDSSVGTWRWEDKLGFGADLWSCAASSSGELYAFCEDRQQVMKYDGEKNGWTAIASLPQSICFLTCATQWRDLIFVGTLDTGFMFNPSTGQWERFEVNCDGGEGFAGTVVSAATVEI
jgi:hypothetical protein